MQATSSRTITAVKDGTILSPRGFSAAGIHSKVKFKRKDLGVLYSDVPAEAAAVYTTNQIVAAPLTLTKETLNKEGKVQAVIVNSGNANACTGKQGMLDAYRMRKETADMLSIPESLVAVASTGVIGEPMPMDKISGGIKKLVPQSNEAAADDFNESILTTDTCKKSACYEAVIGGKKVTMAGSAKGSGMIAPNMATMLAFISTDAAVPAAHLQTGLNEAINETFNRITVDGDTSTNDMVLAMANGLAGNEPLSPDHEDWAIFMELLKRVCEDLAVMIAKDGEGATKLIEVEVYGAFSDEDAGKAAKRIVGSDLVKTMVYGSDPNWGRVVAAVGASGITLDPEAIDIQIGGYPLLEKSQTAGYSEDELKAYLANEKIEIAVGLNVGAGKGKAWGCDLTYDYVKINASYRT